MTPGNDRSPTGRAALDAEARGWSVVPLHSVRAGTCTCGSPWCPAPGKHARVAWKRYMEHGAGPSQLQHWWRRWPGANVGVVTGTVSDLVVLDVDPRHGGGGSLAALEAVHGRLPPTVEVRTGGGGRHLYFSHPGGAVTSGPIAPGLDVKGDGGLVVCPPSIHASGDTYAWQKGRAPGETPLARPPDWLLRPARGGGRPSAWRDAAEVPARTPGERAEFAGLWARIGVDVVPGDHNYLCPFHPDHHPSLHVDAEGCRFHCFGCGIGGGPGRLRRLVEDRAPVGTGPRTEAPGVERRRRRADGGTAPLTVHGDELVRVVGESVYQDTLLALTGGRRRYGGVRQACVAHLVPEPDNPVDSDAIAVRIGEHKVGYLSHADALRLGPAVDAALERWGRATCTGTIVGGWQREHGQVGHFGVRLRLTPARPCPEDPAPSEDPAASRSTGPANGSVIAMPGWEVS